MLICQLVFLEYKCHNRLNEKNWNQSKKKSLNVKEPLDPLRRFGEKGFITNAMSVIPF